MMHIYDWDNGWFSGTQALSIWVWPIVLVGIVAFALYFGSKLKSGSNKK